MTTIEYVISFLLSGKDFSPLVWYGKAGFAPDGAKLVIVPSDFFADGIYGTRSTIPKTPFSLLPETDIPFLFGKSKVEHDTSGRIILHADLVASAYFMLSRYEETIKPECRDQHGRFLSKDAVVFQQGYGMRPLVDEWGRYMRNLLRKSGVGLPTEKSGFKKIYLTHDVDVPFMFYRKEQVVKQWIKNLILHGRRVSRPLYIYNHPEIDPQNTFERIIEIDTNLQKRCGKELVEPIYFIIAAGSKKTKSYCSILLKKFQILAARLADSGATLGLHVSFEAGTNPELIRSEMERLLENCPGSCTKSRHHYLRWAEPEHIEQMVQGGITEDFTLEYADCVGFRVGTCRPYYFINPRSQRVSKILEHPMAIMECSLDRPNYMGLVYEDALSICRQLIDVTREFNGELVLLFHNPIWSEDNYYGKLYEDILEYLSAYTYSKSN